MLLVQEFLKNKTFGDLRKEHGVEISLDSKGYKFSLNYNQIESREDDVLAQQCRGLILCTATGKLLLSLGKDLDDVCPGDTRVLAYPMNRFFNHGQGAAATIDWNKFRIFEKLDGTLCIVYYDDLSKEWNVATRSVPEANIPLSFPLYTFRTLFEKALKESYSISFEDFTKNLNKERTYCFELTTPYNRIVVKYQHCSIHLLAVRDISSMKELDLSVVDECAPVAHVKIYDISSLDEIIKYVNDQDPINHEGVVIRDDSFNRIKIKNASYVVFNKLRDQLSGSHRNCLSIILAKKDDDVLPYVPDEIGELIISMRDKLRVLIGDYNAAYARTLVRTSVLRSQNSDWNERKSFAIAAQEEGKKCGLWTAPFFDIYLGKSANLADFLEKKSSDGEWPNSILDNLISQMGYDEKM